MQSPPLMWPTMEELEAADQDQLYMWHRFLPPPMTQETLVIEQRIFDRWRAHDETPEAGRKGEII